MNDRLRDLLREGDPAAGDSGLSPEEVQSMRRTVLSAAPEPRRRGWLVPALATAAALILAAVLMITLGRTPPEIPEPGPVMAAPIIPTPIIPTPIIPAPTPEPEPPVLLAEEKPEEKPEPLAVAPAAPVLPEQQAVLPAASAAPEDQRQIQFSTPGGTRVIWVLNPATE